MKFSRSSRGFVVLSGAAIGLAAACAWTAIPASSADPADDLQAFIVSGDSAGVKKWCEANQGQSALRLKGDSPVTGLSPIAFAILKGQAPIAIHLIAAGMDPNLATADGITPLMVAASKGEGVVTHMLLDEGAKVNARSGTGRTALHYAMEVLDPGVLETLLDRGADWRMPFPDGESILERACSRPWNGGAKVARLLAHGAVCDTPGNLLSLAITQRAPDTVAVLIAGRVDVQAPDAEGKSPLHLVAQIMQGETGAWCAQILSQAGAKLDALDRSGDTPALVAAEYKNDAVLLSLLKLGADLKKPDPQGNTVLMQAVKKGVGVPVLRAVAAAGVSPTHANHKGETVLTLAQARLQEHDDPELRKLIEEWNKMP